MSRSLRKILSLVALVALVFVGGRLVGVIGAGPVPVEIRYRLGPTPPGAVLEVDFHRAPAEPPVARFETRLLGPEVVERTRLPAGAITVDATLVGAAGGRRTVSRDIEAGRDAVIRIDLTREASAWPP